MAYRILDLSHKAAVNVPHPTSHVYDLSGGYYVLGEREGSEYNNTKLLRFFDLSTCASGSSTRRKWHEIEVHMHIVDFCLGPKESDLVAVVGIKHGQEMGQGSMILSLRELSTRLPHPLARQPDITIGKVDYKDKFGIVMEVVGPHLLLLLSWQSGLRSHKQDRLLLFNWWSGVMLMKESTPYSRWNNFVFLSPELVLLANRENGLVIVHLPDTNEYLSDNFRQVLRLSLPMLQPLFKVGTIKCHADRNAIILLQITYCREPLGAKVDSVDEHEVSLVVHREALLELVDIFSGEANHSGRDASLEDESTEEVPAVPWARWESHTRWHIDDLQASTWSTVTAGQRYVGMNSEGKIVLKDYDAQAVHRASASVKDATRSVSASSGSNSSVSSYEADSEIRKEEEDDKEPVRIIKGYSETELAKLRELFSEGITTSLPYVEHTSQKKYKYKGILMDNEHIIGLKYFDNKGAISEFDVFTL